MRSHWPDYVQNHTAKIAFLTLVGALVGPAAAQGVWLAHGGLKKLAAGLFFSILVAAVYVPTHLTLARVGASICDQAFPAVPPTASQWEERTAQREKLAAVLDLDGGLVGRFKTSVAIVTPLLGSLVGLLLK